MIGGTMKVEWIDRGRESACSPNPAYPEGMDVDISGGALISCTTELPYPAMRCGLYVVECPICGMKTGVTTAGRADDPRSLTVACKPLARA